jgi:glycosyltransferase involved in cell wall biosynthesis
MHDRPAPNRPHRLLYVQHTADLYGANRALLHLIGAIDRERYVPLVALPMAGPIESHLRSLGVEPIVAPHIRVLWGYVARSWRMIPFGLSLLPAAIAMRHVIRQHRADLVHSNTWTTLSGGLGARLAGVPHVWHIREILPNMGGLKPALIAFSLRNAQRLICISQAVAGQFAGRAGAERIRVIYDGIPLAGNDSVGAGRPDDKQEHSELVVGLVGRLHPQKGQAELLHAAALLDPGLRARCRFVCVGGSSPGYEDFPTKLRTLARELGVADQFEWLGFVEDARALTASFDILVLPATQPEGLGGVLLEAMAARVPVIATRAGGPAEVIEHGVNGLLIPSQQPAALARALEQFLGDPRLRRRLGDAGRLAVEQRFSATRTADAVEQIYQELLEPAA